MARIAASVLIGLGWLFAVAALAPSPAAAYTAFWSPRQDVGCVVDRDYARCDTRRQDWAPPRRPAWCRLSYGQGLIVTWSGQAGLVCADDTALLASFRRVLPQRGLVRRGRLGCRSTTRGMLCTNYATRTGFLVSRRGYRLYTGR